MRSILKISLSLAFLFLNSTGFAQNISGEKPLEINENKDFVDLTQEKIVNKEKTSNGLVHLDGVKAVIGNAVVLKSDVDLMLEQLKEQGVKNKEHEDLCHVWEELLFQKLLVHSAELDSLEVTDKEVDFEISRRLKYLLTQMGGSEVEFEKYFDKSVLEFKKEMRPVIRESLKVRRMQAKISQDVQISPAEVKEYYEQIPKDSLPIISEQYKIAQIIIKPVPSEYERNRLRKKIDEIREEIIKGKDFGLMALLHSQDPGSKIKKGELGFVSRDQLVPAFSAAAFKLKEGEVSEVVESEFGYHLIQMIERKGTFVNVRHILLTPKVYSTDLEICKNRVDSVLLALKEEGANFNKMASEVSDDVRTAENGGVMVNYQNGDDYFAAEELEENLFFMVQKLTPGVTSSPELIQVQRGKNAYRLVHLMDKIDFHIGTIETDYAQIKKAGLAAKKKLSVEKWVGQKVDGSYIKLPEECKKCENLKIWNLHAVSE